MKRGAKFGHIVSEETRKKIKRGMKGKKNYLGKHHSEETKRKIGKANSGRVFTEEHKRKIGALHSGVNSPHWKGNQVGYTGLHDWVRKVLGDPQKCEHCGTTTAKKFEWSNKNHIYNRRNINDWVRLCASCHKRYELKNNLRTINNRNNKGQFVSKNK